MTLVEHLAELRRRVLVSAVAFVVAATVAFILYHHILPSCSPPTARSTPRHCNLYVTSPLDGLSLRIKIAAYGGLFLASPVILWELWRFITPGLNPNEKSYAVPFIVASIVLFALGCLVAFVTFPHALQFLDNIGGPKLQQIYNPNKLPRSHPLLMTVFGLTFEFPVLLVSLEIAGVLTPAEAGVVAALGHRGHRGRRRGDHPERRPVLHAGPGHPALRLLRGVDRHREVLRTMNAGRSGESSRRRWSS